MSSRGKEGMVGPGHTFVVLICARDASRGHGMQDPDLRHPETRTRTGPRPFTRAQKPAQPRPMERWEAGPEAMGLPRRKRQRAGTHQPLDWFTIWSDPESTRGEPHPWTLPVASFGRNLSADPGCPLALGDEASGYLARVSRNDGFTGIFGRVRGRASSDDRGIRPDGLKQLRISAKLGENPCGVCLRGCGMEPAPSPRKQTVRLFVCLQGAAGIGV